MRAATCRRSGECSNTCEAASANSEQRVWRSSSKRISAVHSGVSQDQMRSLCTQGRSGCNCTPSLCRSTAATKGHGATASRPRNRPAATSKPPRAWTACKRGSNAVDCRTRWSSSARVGRALLRQATAGVALLGAGSRAQTAFPNKAITLIVPYTAGGASDIGARLLGVDVAWLGPRWRPTSAASASGPPPYRIGRRGTGPPVVGR